MLGPCPHCAYSGPPVLAAFPRGLSQAWPLLGLRTAQKHWPQQVGHEAPETDLQCREGPTPTPQLLLAVNTIEHQCWAFSLAFAVPLTQNPLSLEALTVHPTGRGPIPLLPGTRFEFCHGSSPSELIPTIFSLACPSVKTGGPPGWGPGLSWSALGCVPGPRTVPGTS